MVGRAGTRVPRDLLLDLAAALEHRGPDGCGLLLDGSFGMVNTRLAIVDPRGGAQPLSSEDGRYHAMQNGEIYNYVELRRELERAGHRFATTCDTEVIVHAYEEWGTGCLAHFNGDFALAVWDREERELFLARDRFGVRPLYLAEAGGDLVFASEIRAILRHPGVVPELDPEALTESFVLWSISPSRSAIRGVRQLPPAFYLRRRADGTAEERCWWDLPFEREEPYRTGETGAYTEELARLLDDSTRLRLRADVEVGAYVSGGVDSSAIAALARRHVSRLRGFGVGFSDPAFDEQRFQNAVASRLAIGLRTVVMDDAAIAQEFPAAVLRAEQPTLRTALAPLHRLSALVREAGIKVVLTGEGADELFGGYDIFREDRVRRFWAREPSSVLRPLLLRRLYPYLPRELARGGAMLESFFARDLADVGDALYSHRIRIRNGVRALAFFQPDVAAPVEAVETSLRDRLPPGFSRFGPLARAQYLETATFLTGYLLHAQGDRMLMAHGVEGRFPFLDHRVAEFAAKLPSSMRLLGLREKHLLRRTAAALVPPQVAERGKQPYRAPVARVLAGHAAPDELRELLAPAALSRAGLFSPERVARLVAKAERAGDRPVPESEEMALCGILSTMILHEGFRATPSASPLLVPERELILDRREPAPGVPASA
jgi:asparagine synthase (glutamine-hydrolysing)